MKKLIASAVVILAASAAAYAAPVSGTLAGIASWNSNIESPITACARQFPGAGPGYKSKYKEGTNGWFECYYY